MPTPADRHLGCLLGLAVGDAVGTSVEFMPPGTFVPVTDMTGGGPFRLRAGQWTDDTSMALCLAESLIECEGFDPEDQMRRYLRWWREGYWSSTGECFDIGNTVRAALQRFEQTGEPFSGSDDPYSAGNGSLMRLAPEIAEIASGSFKHREPPEIEGSGYVVRCLEAALWAFHHSQSFRDGCLLAVNLGDDADTTAAVYGQLAGAFYGASGIPEEWRGRVAMLEAIRELAEGLFRGGGPEK